MKLREAHMKTSAAKTIERKAIYTALTLSVLFSLVGLHRAEAGVNVWTTNGPHSETINALAIDPQTPTTLYAGTSGDGVFKSTDGGTTWRAVNTGLDPRRCCFALAIDPQTPTTLYASTDGGVFKSTDGGESWGGVNTGLTNPFARALAIDPQTPATLYVSTGGGVFKSTDGGGNWRSVLVLSPGTFVLALAIDPQTPMTVYAGTIDATTTGSGHGVFKSTDGGESWSAVNTGLSNQAVLALAVEGPCHRLRGGLPHPGHSLQEHRRRRKLERRQCGIPRGRRPHPRHRSEGFLHRVCGHRRRWRVQEHR